MTGSPDDLNPFAAPDVAVAAAGAELFGFEAPRTAVIGGLYAVIALQLLQLPLQVVYRGGITEPGELRENAFGMIAFGGIALLGGLAFYVTVFLWGRWVLRAARNLRALAPDAYFEFTPASQIWWYFVPLLSMWKPYEGMREIEQVSLMGLDVSEIGDGTKSQVPLWWGLWLSQGAVAIVGSLSGLWVLTMVAGLMNCGAAWAAVRMIRSINRMQARAGAAGRVLSA